MICPACREAEEEKFKEVKDYVSSHKGVGVKELSEACEVEVASIRQWLREERLQFSDDSAIGIECESCGCTIRSGRYCESCKTKMVNSLNGMYGNSIPLREEVKKQTGSKMRFLEK